MLHFIRNSYSFDRSLKSSLKVGILMGIVIFFSILFFQPFELLETDFDNYILIIAGFGTITFMVIFSVHFLFPGGYHKLFELERWNMKLILLFLMLILVFNSVAFCFYLRYVGQVQLSLFLAFKIVLLSLIAAIMDLIIHGNHYLRSQLIQTQRLNTELIEIVSNIIKDKNYIEEFVSESRSEKLQLDLKELIMVKSAENYVEIFYRDNDSVRRKLLRTTLKNIEDQLNPYSFIVRCHRTCIINISHVERLRKTAMGFRLEVMDSEEEIPVSRHYLLSIKSALKSFR